MNFQAGPGQSPGQQQQAAAVQQQQQQSLAAPVPSGGPPQAGGAPQPQPQFGLSNSAAIRAEIGRFESVHPNIYAIYDLVERVDDLALQSQIREHVISIEGKPGRDGGWGGGQRETRLQAPGPSAGRSGQQPAAAIWPPKGAGLADPPSRTPTPHPQFEGRRVGAGWSPTSQGDPADAAPYPRRRAAPENGAGPAASRRQVRRCSS